MSKDKDAADKIKEAADKADGWEQAKDQVDEWAEEARKRREK